MNLNHGPLGRFPQPVASAGVVAVITTIAVAKGIRRVPRYAFAGLHIGLPLRWILLSRQTGQSYSTIANAEVDKFAEWFTEWVLGVLYSLPHTQLVAHSLVVAMLCLYVWRLIRQYDRIGPGDQS